MFEVCLETLLSGVISVSGQNLTINENNNIYYTSNSRTEYVLPDKYNQLDLCSKKERFVKTEKKDNFLFIKTID
jgi:hypothetical protein